MALPRHPSQTLPAHSQYSVFISHAGPDKKHIALPLRSMLRTRGVSAFVDEADLKPGDKASQAMIQAMETAPVGVFILSPEFAARKWPVKELYCFQRREKEADSKRLPKPVLIPVFYRLSVEECNGRFLWSTGVDGDVPFSIEGTRFLERQKHGEDEASLDKLVNAMRSIAGTTGVRNDVGASNTESTEMNGKRKELLNNVCEAILEKVKKITAEGLAMGSAMGPAVGPAAGPAAGPVMDQTISGVTPDDKYSAAFNVPKNRAHVKRDLDTKDTDAECTYEHRIRELLTERLGQCRNVVGVYGAGGMGKTTAVKYIGNTKEIQERFPDGVLYVKLGQDATVQEARAGIVRIVEESGGRRLGEELRKKKGLKEVVGGAVGWFRGKSVLLIVDDIWQDEELGEELLEELSTVVERGNESALLFTTRSKTIAQKAVGRNVHMTAREVHGEEAVGILLRSAGRKREDWEDEDVKRAIEGILEICRGLPVALVVSGKGVGAIALSTVGEKKLAWKEYGSSMEGCNNAVLEKGDYDDYPGLFVNAQASLRALSKGLERSGRSGGAGPSSSPSSIESSERLSEIWKGRFRGLCVLEKQGWGSISMLQRLWQMQSVDETKKAVSALEEVGLLDTDLREMGGKTVMGVTMHDLLNDVAARMAREGGGVEEEHRRLLNAYNVPCGGEGCRGWWAEELAEDSYIHGNVGRHLFCSGGGRELVELVLRPEWMLRQAKVSGIEKMVEDFERGCEVLLGWNSEDGKIEEEMGITVGGDGGTEKRKTAVEGLGFIRDAVRLGSASVTRSGREGFFQVQGRLVEIARVNEAVREYLERMSGIVERPMVHSVRGFLGAPGGALKGIVHLQSGALCMARMREEGQFVCGCRDGWIVVIDVVREMVLMAWEAHGDEVTGITLSEEGNVIVSGSWDKKVKMWNREDGTLLKVFESHQDDVWCVAITRDSTRIISGGWEGAKEWDVESGSVLKEVKGAVYSLAIPQNEECVYLGDRNGIRKWRSDELTREDFGETRRGVGGRSETSPEGWKVWKWCCCGIGTRNDEGESSGDACPDECTDEYTAAGEVPSMTLMNNDRVLVTGHGDGTVRMFNTETMTQIRVLEGHSDEVKSVAASENRQRVVSGSWDDTIRVWSVEGGKEVCAPLRGHGDVVWGVCFMHGDGAVVSCSSDKTVRIWDADGCSDVKEAPCHDGPVLCVAVMPCGRRVLSGSDDKTLRMWDLVNGNQIGSALCGHSDTVRSVAVFLDGDRAVSGSFDRSIRVWDLEGWKEVKVLKGHEDWIYCIAVTPDEGRVVSGSGDKTVRVWELGVGGGRHSTFEGHSSLVQQVFVSTDSSRVVSVSHTEVIEWEIETLAEIRRIENRNARRWPRHMVMSLVGEGEHNRRVYGWVELSGKEVFIRNENGDEDVVVGTLDGAAYGYDISRDGEFMCVATGAAQVGILRIER